MKVYNATLSGSSVLAVDSPYHPAFVNRARKLNGKFSGGIWAFDPRDESRVREALIAVYGTDGGAVDLADVQMTIGSGIGSDKDIFALGRQIASRPARDSRVKLGDGVTILDGKFPSSGGSRNNPSIGVGSSSPVTVLVRDVPLALARAAAEEDPEIYTIVTEPPPPTLEVIELGGTALDYLALLRLRHPGLSSAEIVSAALSAFAG